MMQTLQEQGIKMIDIFDASSTLLTFLFFFFQDYEIALELKEKVIPHAVLYFIGEMDGQDHDNDEDEDEDEKVRISIQKTLCDL